MQKKKPKPIHVCSKKDVVESFLDSRLFALRFNVLREKN